MHKDYRVFFYIGDELHFAIPAPNFYGTKEDLIKQTVPAGIEWAEVHIDDVPSDLYFFHAWELKDKKIHINLEKAKDIHIDFLREDRDKKLAHLDKEMMIAIERGDEVKKVEVASKKQQLRDMPKDPVFHAASNHEELRQIVPEYLR